MGFQGMPAEVGGWDAEREIRTGRSIGFTRDTGVGLGWKLQRCSAPELDVRLGPWI